jgi:hypothetical protein
MFVSSGMLGVKIDLSWALAYWTYQRGARTVLGQ